jgi:hypothetical protein
MRHWAGEMSVSVAVVNEDVVRLASLPGEDGADHRVEGMSASHVREIWMPAAAPDPPTTWKVFPDPTLTGWALNGPQNPRWAALPVRSNDTTAVGEPDETNDWVVSGTPTADPDEDVVDWPSDVHPPAVYPDVCVPMSVPAADAVDSVELSRSFIAEVPTGVPIAVPGMPAAPVGVSPFSRIDTRAWSMAAI